MKKIVFSAAAVLLATGAAFAQGATNSLDTNTSDRPSLWQTQPQGSLDYNSSASISTRNTGTTGTRSDANTPVYNGLGAGTDNGQYISLPPIVYGK